MIPTALQIGLLWDIHMLPEAKRNHCTLVARVATWFARRLLAEEKGIIINMPLLESAALLHDIDKAAQKLPHEHHPDAGVRILRDAGFPEVADLVRTHPLHAILDQTIAPSTIEQKLLYLSDKMVKHSIITVDERFALWRGEKLPDEAVRILEACYPRVKDLESEICGRLHVAPADVVRLANVPETSTMNVSL